MAISRAQMMKELLPGLNALFGLEYQTYEDESAAVYETESSERAFEEEVKLSGFGAAPVKKQSKIISTTPFPLGTPRRLRGRWLTRSR